VVVVIAAVLGRVRDYRFMATFPQWAAYAPGLAPILAVSGTYLLGIAGRALMRLIAGPAAANRLARRPWGRAA
jgi:hypothetical protein